MSNTLRQKATSGVIWSAVERFGQQGCAFVVQLVLARLLAPEEFGLIAMVVVFITISSVLVDAGFSRALIQRKEVGDVELSTVFYFNILISILLAGALILAAPAIASFYGMNELSSILRVLSLGLVLSAFGVVHGALLKRRLQFKKLFWVSFPSTIISGAVGIFMVVNGYGVWSLVGQALCARFVGSLFLWVQSGWHPRLIFDLACLREMLPYGSRLALSGVLDQGFQNLYVLVIGKLFTPVDVGLFQRARSFQQLPIANVQTVLARVAFPLFSSIQDDPARMKRGMRKANQIICLLVFPGMALLSATAEPMIITLIGDKWSASAPYLQWLCVVGAIYPLQSINLNLLASIGRSDLFLRLEIVKKFLVVVNIAITFRFGVQFMIYGMVVTALIALLLNTRYTHRFIGYTVGEQLRDVLPMIFLAAVVFISAFTITRMLPEAQTASFLLSVVCGVVLSIVSLRFFNVGLKAELRELFTRIPMGEKLGNLVL